jgi:hypothetical protein
MPFRNITIVGCGSPTIYTKNNCNSYSRHCSYGSYSSDSSYESLLSYSRTHHPSRPQPTLHPRTNVSYKGVCFTHIFTNQLKTKYKPKAESESKPAAQSARPRARLIKTQKKAITNEIKNTQKQFDKGAKEQWVNENKGRDNKSADEKERAGELLWEGKEGKKKKGFVGMIF